MLPHPDVVFTHHPQHGLLVRSGWEQEGARTVLQDLGWEWEEHEHGMIPPDGETPVDAAFDAAVELHAQGRRIGYAEGPFGAMKLELARAEVVLARLSRTPIPAQAAGTRSPEALCSRSSATADSPSGDIEQPDSPADAESL